MKFKDELLDFTQASHLIGFGVNKIREWAEEGKFPCHSRNGIPMIVKSDFLQWVESVNDRVLNTQLQRALDEELIKKARKKEQMKQLNEAFQKNIDKSEKPPLSYIWDFAPALEELSRVFEEGSRKYGRGSWRKVGYKFSQRANSLNRHLSNRMKGEKLDHESGRNNLIMVAWNAMFLYMLEEGHAEGEVDL